MSSLRTNLIGAWALVEYKAYLPSDLSNIYHPMGAEAKGIIMYTPNGYMSAQIQAQEGVKAALPSSLLSKQVDSHYMAYTGRFFLDEEGDEKGTILVHEMQHSNWPNFVGDHQRRLCKMTEEDGNQFLTLSVDGLMEFGDVQRAVSLKWKRLAMNNERHAP